MQGHCTILAFSGSPALKWSWLFHTQWTDRKKKYIIRGLSASILYLDTSSKEIYLIKSFKAYLDSSEDSSIHVQPVRPTVKPFWKHKDYLYLFWKRTHFPGSTAHWLEQRALWNTVHLLKQKDSQIFSFFFFFFFITLLCKLCKTNLVRGKWNQHA